MADRKKQFIEWVESFHFSHHIGEITPGVSPDIANAYDSKEDAIVDKNGDRVTITIEVSGTSYEGRSERIEYIKAGDSLTLKRDRKNQYDSNCIGVFDKQNESLGNLPGDLSACLAPLLDHNEAIVTCSAFYVEPKSQRSKKARKSILFVKIEVELKKAELKNVNSVLCFVGGDQINVWAQKIRVVYSSMPLNHAKLIFELINRQNNEYDENNNEGGYAGLDNLQDEINFMREKMRKEKNPNLDYGQLLEDYDNQVEIFRDAISNYPDRYGCLEDYFGDEYDDDFSLEEFFDEYLIGEEEYFWVEQTRVTEDEYDGYAYGYNHWYDVVELFEKLPFDFNDHNIVSCFGSGKCISLVDLSYGC